MMKIIISKPSKGPFVKILKWLLENYIMKFLVEVVYPLSCVPGQLECKLVIYNDSHLHFSFRNKTGGCSWNELHLWGSASSSWRNLCQGSHYLPRLLQSWSPNVINFSILLDLVTEMFCKWLVYLTAGLIGQERSNRWWWLVAYRRHWVVVTRRPPQDYWQVGCYLGFVWKDEKKQLRCAFSFY